jgi:[ribosomal protein S5]-alanine N-acetyltransferase
MDAIYTSAMPLPLETNRLLIRPFTEADLLPLHETVRSDPDVMRYIPRPVARSVEETATALNLWIEGFERIGLSPLAVTDKSSGIFLGICGVFPLGMVGPEMEIAWIFGRRYWGQGYATEAARACLDCGLTELGLDRILAIIFPENASSIRVAEKLGMVCDGIGRFYDHDMLRYVNSKL